MNKNRKLTLMHRVSYLKKKNCDHKPINVSRLEVRKKTVSGVLRHVNNQQGTNVAHNVRGELPIDLTIIVAIALLSLKLTDVTQWNVGAVVLEQFLLLTKWCLSEY